MSEIFRSSVLAVKEEVSEGTLILPAAANFIPIRSGFSATGAVETITSDENTNDIGASKSYVSKEAPTASVPMYFKHSGVEGQAPQYSILIKSLMGQQTNNSTEYNTIAGSTAGNNTTRAAIKVDAGEGALFAKGQALLIKDGVNNYRVRNVHSISIDDLSLNFNLPAAPALGVNLGKAIHFAPVSSGHPTFSLWHHQASLASSAFAQALAGCRTTGMSMNFPSNAFAEISFEIEGTKFYFNPLIVDATNDKINFNEGGSEITATISSGVYNNPHALAREIESKLNSVATANITCTYSNTTGKFTIVSDGATFEIEWKTGTNGADNTDTHIGSLIGFSDAADDTGALTYTSDNEINLAPAVTPSYDTSDSIIVRDSELMIGSFGEYICRKAYECSFSISGTKTDVLSLCSPNGIDSSLLTAREVSFTAKLILSKYEAGLFDKFINNLTTSLVFNTGIKSANNWVPGTIINVYIPNASITAHPIAEQDGSVVIDVEATGFVDSNQKDIHINFL